MASDLPLFAQVLWTDNPCQNFVGSREAYRLAYERAKAMCTKSGLCVDDIVNLSPKFWKFHKNLIMTRDVSAFQIAQIHLNICVGMIGTCVQDKPALQPVLDQLMSFEAIGSIFITELGHGLDVKNIETTATLLPDGCFDLHTPSENAAKAMPPAAPVIGMKRIGIVLARLIVDEEDRGMKLFVVPISDRDKMHSGVTTWLLPVRPGTKPLDHAITAFNHVRLPPESILSSLAKPKDAQLDLHHQLWRLSVGAIALSIGNLNCLQVGTYIAAIYSKRRMVQQNSQMGLVPIISFSTQYRPILQSLAAGEVLRAMTDWCIEIFRNPSIGLHLRRGIAIVYKAVVIHHFALLSELSERCGWRGYYGHNQIAEMYLSFAANAVGEGDVHVLCLRLTYELLTGKYKLPEARDARSNLARYEIGLSCELESYLEAAASKVEHAQLFNTAVLPRCRLYIVAIGQRMAWEAAKDSKYVSQEVRKTFENVCIAQNPSWYVEALGWTRRQILDNEIDALEAIRPHLDHLLDRTDAKKYVTSPLAADDEWQHLIANCVEFGSNIQSFAVKQTKL